MKNFQTHYARLPKRGIKEAEKYPETKKAAFRGQGQYLIVDIPSPAW